ncbi:hypothetical protein [Tropicimonas sp. S265A]|uniref:hypothetical protein n=1 Tax=Tropicimonas sp. S265A TaxID=3415134 RepID=UPI003C7D6D15
MTFKTLLAALFITGTASVASANTDVLPSESTTFTPYGSVEGWSIFVNEDRKTCMIESVDANENVVQMGLTADRGVGYLGVFTKADIGLTSGEDPVAVLIGENLYVGTARTLTTSLRDGYTGGYVVTDDPQFVTDIMQQYTAVVLPNSEFSFAISLDGTMKAIEAARECTAAQGG